MSDDPAADLRLLGESLGLDLGEPYKVDGEVLAAWEKMPIGHEAAVTIPRLAFESLCDALSASAVLPRYQVNLATALKNGNSELAMKTFVSIMNGSKAVASSAALFREAVILANLPDRSGDEIDDL